MKFLNKFNSISDAKAGNDIYSPQVALVKENGAKQVMYSKDDFEDNTKLQVSGDAIGELSFIEFAPAPVPIPNNIIKYMGSSKVTPANPSVFGANYIDDKSTFDSGTGEGALVFGGDVTKIGYSAFYNCSSFTSVTIPNSATIIENNAFQECRNLTYITIGNSVTSIGYGAFSGCTSLKEIVCESTTPPTISSGLFDNTNNCPIYVPSESVETYKNTSAWSTYAYRIQAITA